MRFTVGGPQATDVAFHAEIDEDGDLMLYANGHELLFISSGLGKLCRVAVPDETRKLLPGLRFDAENRIAVTA